jgi:hypothetical protein
MFRIYSGGNTFSINEAHVWVSPKVDWGCGAKPRYYIVTQWDGKSDTICLRKEAPVGLTKQVFGSAPSCSRSIGLPTYHVLYESSLLKPLSITHSSSPYDSLWGRKSCSLGDFPLNWTLINKNYIIKIEDSFTRLSIKNTTTDSIFISADHANIRNVGSTNICPWIVSPDDGMICQIIY